MMDLTKLKEFIMCEKTFMVCATTAVIALILSITFSNYNELRSVEKNVESAIVKGIDPVAVRCAYAKATDTVCIAYAAAIKK